MKSKMVKLLSIFLLSSFCFAGTVEDLRLASSIIETHGDTGESLYFTSTRTPHDYISLSQKTLKKVVTSIHLSAHPFTTLIDNSEIEASEVVINEYISGDISSIEKFMDHIGYPQKEANADQKGARRLLMTGLYQLQNVKFMAYGRKATNGSSVFIDFFICGVDRKTGRFVVIADLYRLT